MSISNKTGKFNLSFLTVSIEVFGMNSFLINQDLVNLFRSDFPWKYCISDVGTDYL